MNPLQEVKWWLMGATGLSKDALHVYVGMGVLLGAAWLGRWRVGDWRPLLAVLLVALAGELWDLIDNIRTNAPMQWRGHGKDILNTLFWPTVLTLLAQTRLFRRS
ncbi:hypothetical protein [Sandaracinobacter neustonicus]|nr:hypothetical protein [Sandaracinobacter neustonicus]